MEDDAQADRFAAVAHAQTDLDATGLNPRRALALAAEHAVALTGGHGAGVELIEDDELVLAEATGSLAGVRGRRLARAGNLSGRCVASGQALRCDDTEDDPRADGVAAAESGTASAIVAPITSDGDVTGVLKVVSHRPGAFTNADVSAVALLARLLAASLARGRTLAALARERDATSTIVEATPALVVVLDPRGGIVRFNRACEELTGWTRHEVVGRLFWDLFVPPEELDRVRTAFLELEHGRVPNRTEHHWRTRDGSPRLIAWSNTAVRSDEGEPVLIVATGVDVTELRAADADRPGRNGTFRDSALPSLELSPADLVVVVDVQAIVRYASPAAERLLGWEGGAGRDGGGVGVHLLDLVHPQDRTRAETSMFDPGEAAGVDAPIDVRLRHADGSWVTVEILVSDRLDDPAVAGIVVTMRDIGERRRAEALFVGHTHVLEMVARREPLAATLDALAAMVEAYIVGARCALVLVGDDGRTLHTAAAPSLGADIRLAIDGAALPRGEDALAAVVTEPGWANLRSLLRTHGLTPAWSAPVAMAGEEQARGAVILLADPSARVTADERRLLELSGRLAAIAVREADAEAELAYRATRDLLTGLANRSMFLDHLTRALARVERRPWLVALLLLNIDGFKPANERLGQDGGDELLRVIAGRLHGVLRPSDTVARFGADDFAMLCEDLADDDDACAVAERVGAMIAEPIVVDGTEVRVTASIGVALARGPGMDPNDLLRTAAEAVVRAKGRGAGRFELL